MPWAWLRSHADFGFEELDLCRPPGRFWADGEPAPPSAEVHIDARRVEAAPAPAELLSRRPAAGDTWEALSRRSVSRLLAWFLVVEDPQRRLDAQPIVTLAHQASVVQHILHDPSLRRVLLADEVGLGKTVEAGLLIREVLAREPGARVLYLAPARLVRNVRRELDRLGLGFRSWVATPDRDGKLEDPRIVASIHRASIDSRMKEVLAAPPWDMIVVDECHHLTDWASGGGKPGAHYRLVERLAEGLGEAGRLVLMSGTPHQGNPDRFKNLLGLLRRKGEGEAVLGGRVIYRTKEDVRDWQGRPLFPLRRVNEPIVVDLPPDHRAWLEHIHDFFEPRRSPDQRAAGWRAGQALQWATSSVQAGLGYLARQAIRAGCEPASMPALRLALAAIRPYRLGPEDEPVDSLFARMSREVARQIEAEDLEDLEDLDEFDDGRWRPHPGRLAALLYDGIKLLESAGDAKWKVLFERVLEPAGDEKVVLFAQPIETVTAVAGWLTRRMGRRPALILGGQSEAARSQEIAAFWEASGPQFLVSSRAGGEGLNLQVARRLVHLDVPWNPMDLEQRIGRVHRFLSRRTIVVDTLVVHHSREVDTYACAREKLKAIASTLVPEDRFEALFGRVMSLVPPAELADILGHAPVGPLDAADEAKLAELVRRGFEQWRGFHDRYAEAQGERIAALDAGEAGWGDLGAFARRELGATDAAGFSALRFLWQDGEVVAAPEEAAVLAIGGDAYACGDHGGMPVTRDDGGKAAQLGLNVPLVARALRAAAFPAQAAGAAYLRWPEGEPRPLPGIFGVVAAVRQSLRWEQGAYAEQGAALRCALVGAGGEVRAVEAPEKGRLVRALARAEALGAPVGAPGLPGLIEAMRRAEAEFVAELRWESDADREDQRVHAVTPLFSAVVEG